MPRTHRGLAKNELKKPAETRFAYFFLVLSRLLEERQALEQLVTSTAYSEWVAQQNAATKQQAKVRARLLCSVVVLACKLDSWCACLQHASTHISLNLS